MSRFFPILQKAKEDIERLRVRNSSLMEDYCTLVEELADCAHEVERLRSENNHLRKAVEWHMEAANKREDAAKKAELEVEDPIQNDIAGWPPPMLRRR